MKVCIAYHEKFIEHNLGVLHPERPRRLVEIVSLLRKELYDKLDFIEPKEADEKDLLKVHSKDYIDLVKRLSERGGLIDLDTPVPKGTFEIAKLAVGAGIRVVSEIHKESYKADFALVRPPGHHAGKDFGGGFCYFNNIAIAVRYLQSRGIKKCAILDWDAHHGNGTQDIFYDDPTVLYFSTHQSPLYPGTGKIDEIGINEGEGYNINFPLKAGTTGKSFEFILDEIFIPVVREFEPDFVLVSAGYDAYFRDPLTNLNFTVETYANATRKVKELSEEICEGRLAFFLEGGYELKGLSYSVLATVSTLVDSPIVIEPYRVGEQKVDEYVKDRVEKLKKVLMKYWSVF